MGVSLYKEKFDGIPLTDNNCFHFSACTWWHSLLIVPLQSFRLSRTCHLLHIWESYNKVQTWWSC